jgi:uncharacterized membrane protein YphA (DoxX/SURF4 family)
VYVLTPTEIQQGLSTPAFNMLAVAKQDAANVFFWGFIAALTIFAIFFISIGRVVERALVPAFRRIRPWAPHIARVTVGISFLAAAYYGATYGPELPMAPVFGQYVPLLQLILVVMGLCIIFGYFVRTAAVCALLLFGYATYRNGLYMLTYTNYLGEVLVLVLFGMHTHKDGLTGSLGRLARALEPYSFLILRVAFGTSLFYAALYAKVLHNDLALQVASLPLAGHMYNIAHYLHFEPHFLVLGAAIIEFLIAIFFLLGIEIRFTSLFLEFWLSLSLIYFGEVVWPHLILIGIPIAFICYGYDRYSVEGYFFKKRRLEPVL